jgi:Nitronate monooxygenase
MLKTTLCRRLGIDYPIFSVGMGPAAGPDLAAAVSNAGGCGVLGGAPQSAPYLRRQIQRLRTLTAKPFGVNVVLAVMEKGQLETCLDERVPLLVLFWGDAKPYVEDARRRGTKVLLQVGSVEEAVTAAEAGVDAIIAQGVEAGGHVKGTTSLSALVPAIVEAVSPVPVLAAACRLMARPRRAERHRPDRRRAVESSRGVGRVLDLGAMPPVRRGHHGGLPGAHHGGIRLSRSHQQRAARADWHRHRAPPPMAGPAAAWAIRSLRRAASGRVHGRGASDEPHHCALPPATLAPAHRDHRRRSCQGARPGRGRRRGRGHDLGSP